MSTKKTGCRRKRLPHIRPTGACSLAILDAAVGGSFCCCLPSCPLCPLPIGWCTSCRASAPPPPLPSPPLPSPQGGPSVAGRALLSHLLSAHPGSHGTGEGGVCPAAGPAGVPLPFPQRLHGECGERAGEGCLNEPNDSGPPSPVSSALHTNRQLSTANCQPPTYNNAVHRGSG